jgi:uncharacterized protein (TIGR02594 family)
MIEAKGNGEMPHWLDIAYKESGVSETPGESHTLRILEYHKITTLGAKTDETPWCASFVGWCLEQAGITSTRSAAARSYLSWGYELKIPKEGCIVILERGKAPQGHVGFYVGSDDVSVCLLGGNQANQVSEQLHNRKRVLGYRWPYPP